MSRRSSLYNGYGGGDVDSDGEGEGDGDSDDESKRICSGTCRGVSRASYCPWQKVVEVHKTGC